jgi:hypothetical protein
MQSADWVSAEFACASYRQLKLMILGQALNYSFSLDIGIFL